MSKKLKSVRSRQRPQVHAPIGQPAIGEVTAKCEFGAEAGNESEVGVEKVEIGGRNVITAGENVVDAGKNVVAALEEALAAVRELSAARVAAKFSVSRLVGVARELRELIKVMSVYGC